MIRDQKTRTISDNPTSALLVTCSESALHTTFGNLLDPACIFQNFGGALPAASVDSGWGTVEYSIEQLALKRIVLCGHSHCRAPMMQPPMRQTDPTALVAATQIDSRDEIISSEPGVRSQLWLVEQIKRLASYLDRSAHRADIISHVLWFNDDRGTIFRWSLANEGFIPANYTELTRLLGLLGLSFQRTQDVLTQFEEFSRRLISRKN